jgi:hypothetical protein
LRYRITKQASNQKTSDGPRDKISPTTNVTITEETEPEVVTPDQIVTFNDLKKLQT